MPRWESQLLQPLHVLVASLVCSCTDLQLETPERTRPCMRFAVAGARAMVGGPAALELARRAVTILRAFLELLALLLLVLLPCSLFLRLTILFALHLQHHLVP